jgi:hypothetical protein
MRGGTDCGGEAHYDVAQLEASLRAEVRRSNY